MKELREEKRKLLKELKNQARKKIILQCATIITGIITAILIIYGGIYSKKNIAKAEEITQTYYYINAVNSIPVDNYNNLTARSPLQITNEQSTQGIFYTKDYETEYKINRIYISTVNPNGIQFDIRLTDENNTSIGNIQLIYTYNSTTQEREYTGSQQNVSANSDITAQTIFTTKWTKGNYVDTYLQNNSQKQQLWNYFIQYGIIQEYTETLIQLQAPTITLNLNTLQWEYIENAEYYNIFKNGQLIGQTYYNNWVTIENGVYTVQACTNNTEEYANSNISNSITQNNYNDMIGNGVNWFTLMSAIVDSQIYLMKSLLNYTIWDINFFQLFTFIITIILTVFIIKFIKGW